WPAAPVTVTVTGVRVWDIGVSSRFGTARASAEACGQVLVDRGEELLGRQPRLVRADEQGEVLRHLAALDGLDDDVLEGLRELRAVARAAELAAVREATRPVDDRRDRVGRRRLALLVLAVVARDRAVRGLGLDRPAARRHEHARQEPERAEA